jgi:hypothetical protein
MTNRRVLLGFWPFAFYISYYYYKTLTFVTIDYVFRVSAKRQKLIKDKASIALAAIERSVEEKVRAHL